VGRSLVGLTDDTLGELPEPCRSCTFWERGVRRRGPVDAGCPGPGVGRVPEEKRSWVHATTQAWGTCGQVIRVDGHAAGYVLYAPPEGLPGVAAFPGAPSPDAVLLAALRVAPEHQGGGLGRALVVAMARDLTARGVGAVEAYGDRRLTRAGSCVLPARYLEAVGFRTIRRHHRYPRLRMDLRTTVRHREVEDVLDRLLSPLTAPVTVPSHARPMSGPGGAGLAATETGRVVRRGTVRGP
jgi:predicted N-acetyltransferase YhbS